MPPTPPVLTGTTANNIPYVVAVSVMVVAGIVGATVIIVLRPNVDNTLIITALFGFLTSSTLSLLSFMKSQETHLSVNSRLDGEIQNAAAAAQAKGVQEGVAQANQRTDILQKNQNDALKEQSS